MLQSQKTAFEASRKVVSLQSQIQELQHSHHTEQNVCKMAILAYQEVVTAVNESLDIFKTVALPGLTLVMDRAESFDEKIIDGNSINICNALNRFVDRILILTQIRIEE